MSISAHSGRVIRAGAGAHGAGALQVEVAVPAQKRRAKIVERATRIDNGHVVFAGVEAPHGPVAATLDVDGARYGERAAHAAGEAGRAPSCVASTCSDPPLKTVVVPPEAERADSPDFHRTVHVQGAGRVSYVISAGVEARNGMIPPEQGKEGQSRVTCARLLLALWVAASGTFGRPCRRRAGPRALRVRFTQTEKQKTRADPVRGSSKPSRKGAGIVGGQRKPGGDDRNKPAAQIKTPAADHQSG